MAGKRRIKGQAPPPAPPRFEALPLNPYQLYLTLKKGWEMHGVCDEGATLITITANFQEEETWTRVGAEINMTYTADGVLNNIVHFTHDTTECCNWLIDQRVLYGQWREKETILDEGEEEATDDAAPLAP